MLFLLFIFTFSLLESCQAAYSGWAYVRMNGKLIALDWELVKDAMKKLESVDYFKNFYRSSHAYHVARAIYDIKYKFRRMKKVYEVAVDSIPTDYSYNDQTPRLLEVQQLNLGIEHLIDTLVEGENEYQKVLQKRQRQLEKARNKTLAEQQNKTVRAGRPVWSYKSFDSWDGSLPGEIRTPLPVNFGRNRGKPRRGPNRRTMENIDMNYEN